LVQFETTSNQAFSNSGGSPSGFVLSNSLTYTRCNVSIGTDSNLCSLAVAGTGLFQRIGLDRSIDSYTDASVITNDGVRISDSNLRLYGLCNNSSSGIEFMDSTLSSRIMMVQNDGTIVASNLQLTNINCSSITATTWSNLPNTSIGCNLTLSNIVASNATFSNATYCNLPTSGAGSISLIAATNAIASGTSSITFSNFTDDYLLLVATSMQPMSNAAYLKMEISQDFGSNWWGAGGYTSGIYSRPYNATTVTNSNSTATTILTSAVSSSYSVSGTWNLTNTGTANYCYIYGKGTTFTGAGVLTDFDATAITQTGVNRLKVSFSSGNINTGNLRLYSVKST
jgi:hypothetical protein